MFQFYMRVRQIDFFEVPFKWNNYFRVPELTFQLCNDCSDIVTLVKAHEISITADVVKFFKNTENVIIIGSST
jgi:hypothetical protein